MDDNATDEIEDIKHCLMHRIMNREKNFKQHHEQWDSIKNLFQKTIQLGESNSALLIGSRRSGKTLLVDEILNDLSKDEHFEEKVEIVKLNGLVHTSDKIALNGITRQMKLENVVGEKVFGTFAENLTYLLDCLKSGSKKTSKPIIFILDEFDLFCDHKNQTLLYNLFDVAQSAQAPICVLGITHRLDVIEKFEKRVKSRFSHRQIGMDIIHNNDLKNFRDFLLLIKRLLTLPNEKSCDDIERLYVEKIDKTIQNTWNKSINNLIKIYAVEECFKYLYNLDLNQEKLRNYLISLVCSLSKTHQLLDANDFLKTSEMFMQDDKVFLLKGLSVLEICLVIAMKQETTVLDGEPFNFKMVLQRFNKFAKNELYTISDSVAIKAFEHLKNLELVIPANKQSLKETRDYQMYFLALTPEQVLEVVKSYGLPTSIVSWATSISVK